MAILHTAFRRAATGMALFGLLFCATAASAQDQVRRFSLVAGANDGGEDRVVLRYAETDATKFAEVMQELGGLSPKDTVVLSDPDLGALEDGFRELEKKLATVKAGERTEVIFYYSGHSDETGLLLRGEHVTYKTLRSSIDALPADVHIIVLDSCSAGTLTRTKGGAMRPPFLIDESSDVRGHAFLTSSSEDEVAQESDVIGGSFFTHYLVSGLRGGADVSEDGKVTLNEAYQFAFEETLRRTEATRSGPQHAAYEIQLSGTGDLVLTDLRVSDSELQLDEKLSGRVYVRDDASRLLAELDKKSGSTKTVHLPPGDYTVRVLQNETLRETQVSVPRGGSAEVTTGMLASVGTEETVARGGPRILPADGESDGSPEPQVDDPDGDPLANADGKDGEYTRVDFNYGLVPGIGKADYVDGKVVSRFSIHLLLGGVDKIDGAAVAGIMNWTPDEMKGFQGAGVGAMAGHVDGFLAAGVYTTAEKVDGAQAAGVANIANEVSGAQIGLVNISGNVRGAQVGLINIAESSDAPIGLINIIGDGIFNVDVWANELAYANVGLKMGGKYLYTLLGVGVVPLLDQGPDENLPPDPTFEQDTGSDVLIDTFVGLGVRVPFTDDFYMDVDLSGGALLDPDGDFTWTWLGRLRAGVGYRFFKHFGVFGGLSLTSMIQTEKSRITIKSEYVDLFEVDTGPDSNVNVWLFPGAFVGMEF